MSVHVSVDKEFIVACVDKKELLAGELLEQVEEPQHLKDEECGATPLHWAAKWGWMGIVRKLVESYICDPACRDKNEFTPLHEACSSGHLDVVEHLTTIKNSVDPMVVSDKQFTPFHLACYKGHCIVVKYLIEHCDCDPATDDHGMSPLHLACCSDLQTVKYLIEIFHCNPMLLSTNGLTPLHCACRYGHLDIVQYLVSQQDVDPMCNAYNFVTPLHRACYYNHISIAKYLLVKCNADPNSEDSNGFIPLHYACAGGHIDIVQYLITEMKCDSTYRSKSGCTPLHVACCFGYLKIVQFLVEQCGCNSTYTIEDRFQTSLIHFAALNGHLDTVRYLVESCHCDPLCGDYEQATPLHYASYNGHLNVIKYLIKEQNRNSTSSRTVRNHYRPCFPSLRPQHMCAPIDYRFCEKIESLCIERFLLQDGSMAMHSACSGHLDNLNVVQYLVEECGCSPNLENYSGSSLLDLALHFGHVKIAKFLIDVCECCESICDRYTFYDSPLHKACNSGYLDMAQYLIVKRGFDPLMKSDSKSTLLHSACSRSSKSSSFTGNMVQVCHCDSICADCCGTLVSSDGFNLSLFHPPCCIYPNPVNIVKYLIEECDCNPNCVDSNGSSPLDLAIYHQHLNVVKYLIDVCECEPKCNNGNGDLPLHEACRMGSLDMVQYLILKCEFKPMMKSSNGGTPLHSACSSYSEPYSVVKYLIEKHGCDPSYEDDDGNSPLDLALNTGHLKTIKYLIEFCKCRPKFDTNSSTLHKVCERGSVCIVQFLIIKCGLDPMMKSGDGSTLLHSACLSYSNPQILVRYLIEVCACNPNCKDIQGNMPLHFSSTMGHLKTVQYLIESCHCDPMCKNAKGSTPLHDSCLNGSLSVTKYLVEECKVDPNCKNINGSTPLERACARGHVKIVDYLKQNANCNLMYKKNDGRTPLHTAAWECATLDITKYLIEQCSCNPDCRDESGDSPLYLASCKGYVETVQYLIETCHCDPLCKNTKGSTPLHGSCLNGNLSVTEYLVDKCKVDQNCEDINGYTPLHYACCRGHVNIVQYLKEHTNCDFKHKSKNGKALLHSAGKYASVGMTKYLIEQCDCNPNCVDKSGDSPLHLASSNGYLETVQYLIEICQRDPLCKNTKGSTPLHGSCLNGNLSVTEYLVDKCKGDPNCEDINGSTPVHYACARGHVNIVQYLEVHTNCNLMYKNNNGKTPLHTAAWECATLDMTKYLIEQCGCNPNCVDKSGDSPLHLASSKGYLDTVQYLVENCGCNAMCKNKKKLTPLHNASENGFFDTVWFLIEICDCDPNCIGNDGEKALHLACLNGHLGIAQYLITLCNCDPMSKTYRGNTPLHLAAYNGHLNVVEFLVTVCKCDPNCKAMEYYTPLYSAHSRGHYKVTEFLLCSGANLQNIDDYNEKEDYSLHTKFYHVQNCLSINSYVNICLIGDPGVGKSTLAQVILNRSAWNLYSLVGRYIHVSNVKCFTAGIVPHRAEHRELGNIILHDLAGHPEYYSSHISVLEDMTQRSPFVFVLLFKITEGEPFKWLNVLKDLCKRNVNTCYLITVASHADLVVEKRDREAIQERAKKNISAALLNEESLCNLGVVYLDCRKLNCLQLLKLKDSVAMACESIRNEKAITQDPHEMMYCQMLYLIMETKGKKVFTLKQLMKITQKKSDYYLPQSKDRLILALLSLQSIGLVKCIQKCNLFWVVVRIEALLTDVNGVLFAPVSFESHRDIASNTGIVSKNVFSQLFPKYDPEMITEFLISMKLCERVDPELMHLTNLSPKPSNATDSELFFFPALMSYTQRPVTTTASAQGTIRISKPFQFGWCLQCVNEHEFITSRFVHLLLLRLAYQNNEQTLKPDELSCIIWSKGILWNTTLGVQNLVEVVDNDRCVLLLMSSQHLLEHNMIHARRMIIQDILFLKKQSCPSTKTKEFVINPFQLQYPIDKPTNLTLYDVDRIAQSVAQGSPCVVSSTRDADGQFPDRKLSELLPQEYNQGTEMSIFINKNTQGNKLLESPVEVLKKYKPRVESLLSNPASLAKDLHANGFLSDAAKEEVIASSDTSRYKKAIKIMENVLQNLNDECEIKYFEAFCDVLKQQPDSYISRIAEDMGKELQGIKFS